MDFKKLIRSYLQQSTPLKSVEFVEVFDPNDKSIKPVAEFMRVAVKWENEVQTDFALPLDASKFEIVTVCHNVALGYYARQQELISDNFIKKHKINGMPSLILPNDMTIIH